MKTWTFEGREYMASRVRGVTYPREGEVYLEYSGSVTRASMDFTTNKYQILVPLPKKGVKAEIKAEYTETSKRISRREVWEAMTEQERDCEEAMGIFEEFDDYFADHGRRWSSEMRYDSGTPLKAYLENNPKLYGWAVERGFLRKVKPKQRYFVVPESPDTAIGEGPIKFVIVDEGGEQIPAGAYPFSITRDGRLARHMLPNNKVGLWLDDRTIKMA